MGQIQYSDKYFDDIYEYRSSINSQFLYFFCDFWLCSIELFVVF